MVRGFRRVIRHATVGDASAADRRRDGHGRSAALLPVSTARFLSRQRQPEWHRRAGAVAGHRQTDGVATPRGSQFGVHQFGPAGLSGDRRATVMGCCQEGAAVVPHGVDPGLDECVF